MDTSPNIVIYQSSGNFWQNSGVKATVIITQEAEHVQELQQSDYIQLSWKSLENVDIPAGAYIYHPQTKVVYTLLDPYKPKQEDGYYVYTPQFQAPAMTWKKVPFRYNGEPDWELTGDAISFMQVVSEMTGYEIEIAEGLPTSAYIKFSNTDTLSALNAIADGFETEWYVLYHIVKTDSNGDEYKTNIIHLGRAEHGERKTLIVGDNVNVPTVTQNSEEERSFYTGYYIYGGTQNITQENNSELVNGVINNRLTLNKDEFPNSYYKVADIGIELSKTLYFDEVYPRAVFDDGEIGLPISNLQAWIIFETDEQGNKVQIGTQNGNPIYSQKAYYFFNIDGFSDILGEQKFEDFLIEGMTAKGQFESGALNGWEFELEYISEDKQFTGSDFDAPFNAKAGMFRLENVKENNIWIPGITGLIPQDGDLISLVNIKLPTSYVERAQRELKSVAEEKIAELQKDYNNYTVTSNPVVFVDNNPNLSIGQAIHFINEDYEYDTRVLKLVTKLDLPCYQTITIGNKQVKGTISSLKEDVANANSQSAVLYNINKMTDKTLQAYLKAQEEMQKGFIRINQMWQFDDDGNIYSPFGVSSRKFISAKGKDNDTSGGTGIDIARMWEELANKSTGSESYSTIIDESHIPDTIARTEVVNEKLSVADMWAKLAAQSANSNEIIHDSHISANIVRTEQLADYATKEELDKIKLTWKNLN